MIRHRNHQLEDKSLAALKMTLPDSWAIHEIHRDYGIDVQIEIFEKDSSSTGFRFYGQLKATDNLEESDTLSLKREHFEYWASHTDPVAIFRYYQNTQSFKWCWAYDLEWRLEPNSQSVSITSHLKDWDKNTSPEQVIQLLKHRSNALNQTLPSKLSLSIKKYGSNLSANIDLAEKLAQELPDNLFTVYGDSSNQCHFQISIHNKKISISYLGLPGYVINLEDNSTLDSIIDLSLILVFILASRHNKTPIIRSLSTKIACKTSAFPFFFPLVLDGLIKALGLQSAIALALQHAPNKNAPTLWLDLITTCSQASEKYGETLSWREQLKVWANSPPQITTQGSMCYNYANNLANAQPHDWSEAVEYYTLALKHDPIYEQRDYYWGELGAALFETGKFEQAALAYKKSYDLSPSTKTQWRLGDALFHSGKYKAAYDELYQSVFATQDPNESLAYQTLVMLVCDEIMTTWSILEQEINALDEKTYIEIQELEFAETEDELIKRLQPYMAMCAIDPLLTFNLGHFALSSNQPHIATYLYLIASLRQKNDYEAWSLALVCALQTQSYELVTLIAENAYFHVGERLMQGLAKALQNPVEQIESPILQPLIELIRSLEKKEDNSFLLRLATPQEQHTFEIK